jgi:predicted nucleic acid-binding protein
MKSITALVDTNVPLDSFLDNEPFKKTAEKILAACGNGKFDGYVAAHSITNIFYILRKKYNTEQRKKLLLKLCNLFDVIGVDHEKVIKALNDASFDDIEDFLQYECGNEVGADYIVTRDPDGFRHSSIPVISPEEFVTLLENVTPGKDNR